MYRPAKHDFRRWRGIWSDLIFRVVLDRRKFAWQGRMTVKGWLRTWAAPDITLLGWPGRRFWHAHLRYRLLYGSADWQRFKLYAEKRHAEWVKKGKPTPLQRGTFGLYVNVPRGDDD